MSQIIKRIPIAKPYITDEEIEAVIQVLKSGILTRGSEVYAFEREFAEYLEVKHGVAVSNGTVALDLALKVVGIREGDEVITTPFTFIATANAILYQRAKPIFADIDSKTYNLDPNSVLEVITPRTKAMLVVHLYGQPADMKAFREIADDYKLLLIEDCAQAHGATFMNKKVGGFGEVAVFSFYATKNMTTGEGGMIVTNDDKIAEKLRILRDQGQTAKYVHEELGYNYRMTNIQAAIGRVQLRRLEKMNTKRIENAQYLSSHLSRVKGINPPYIDSRVKHVFNQYVIKVSDEFPLSRDKLAEKLKEKGVDTAVHYPIPIHRQPLYRRLGYPQNICPNAIEASEKILSLPVHPLLAREDLDYIVGVIKELGGE
uniref:DegT/DnrJ/EryC1/StrS family aminotransferase n=1 Tax=Ignisphaera aggregans TaxID=334771 RepID=A0A7J3Z7N1_9CREN